jgi:hypothetical protein
LYFLGAIFGVAFTASDHSNNCVKRVTTILEGHKLDSLKSIYHDLVSRIVSSGENATLLFSHFGDFDSTKVENTLKLIESGIIDNGDKRATMKRVCGILIELLQNISNHGARDGKGHMHAFLIVAKIENEYQLFTGNLVLSEVISPMRERITQLLGMDITALRKLYIDILCNEEYSSRGGAGLGLVTILKRAENRINFDINPIDKHFGFFRLEVSVPAVQA